MEICSDKKLSLNHLNVALLQVLPQLGHLIGSLLVQLNLVESHYAWRLKDVMMAMMLVMMLVMMSTST